MMRFALLLALSSLPALAQVTNVTITWDARPPSEEVIGYRLWESNALGGRLISFTATNGLVYTNYDCGVAHFLRASSTNATWESGVGPWQRIPVRPLDATNVKPVSLSFVMPVPGDLLVSGNLTDWNTRFHIAWCDGLTAGIDLWQLPDQPIAFARVRP